MSVVTGSGYDVGRRTAGDAALRLAAAAAVATLVLHGLDHLRRGLDVVTGEVLVAANLQALLAIGTAVLIFRRHRWAPAAAVAFGFGNIVGVALAHLVPHWSA